MAITPCRVADTRPTETVGPRNTALTANETHTLTVRGTNGRCTIPADAVGVAVDVAAVSPSADSFFTLSPSDAGTRPLSANLNFTAGQPPVSNSASAATCTTAESFARFAGVVSVAGGSMRVFLFNVQEVATDGGFYCSVYNLGSRDEFSATAASPGQ